MSKPAQNNQPKRKANKENRHAQKRMVYEEAHYYTTKLSDITRYIGVGLLAIVYTLLISDQTFASNTRTYQFPLLIEVGYFGICTVLFDYLQYLFGNMLVKRAQRNEKNDYLYDDEWWQYQWKEVFFILKQGVAGIGAILLLILFILVAVSFSTGQL